MAAVSPEVAGLFAGIGGLELGMAAGGHHAQLLVENAPPAMHVLRRRFPDTKIEADVRDLGRACRAAPTSCVAGFPCQDLSSVGRKVGIDGARSSLVGEVFRLLGSRGRAVGGAGERAVPDVAGSGRRAAADHDGADRARLPVGVPRRRHQRVRAAAAAQPVVSGGQPRRRPPRRAAGRRLRKARCPQADYPDVACGFYWTEGMRSFGWAVDGVPPIKCGSSVGVASPPAIRLPSGDYVTPDLRDTERLQGFPDDWTAPAEEVAKRGERWRHGRQLRERAGRGVDRRRLADPGRYDAPTTSRGPAPSGRAGRRGPTSTAWCTPRRRPVAGVAAREPLADFLAHPGKPVVRAGGVGLPAPNAKGTLRFPAGFIDELTAYAGLAASDA